MSAEFNTVGATFLSNIITSELAPSNWVPELLANLRTRGNTLRICEVDVSTPDMEQRITEFIEDSMCALSKFTIRDLPPSTPLPFVGDSYLRTMGGSDNVALCTLLRNFRKANAEDRLNFATSFLGATDAMITINTEESKDRCPPRDEVIICLDCVLRQLGKFCFQDLSLATDLDEEHKLVGYHGLTPEAFRSKPDDEKLQYFLERGEKPLPGQTKAGYFCFNRKWQCGAKCQGKHTLEKDRCSDPTCKRYLSLLNGSGEKNVRCTSGKKSCSRPCAFGANCKRLPWCTCRHPGNLDKIWFGEDH